MYSITPDEKTSLVMAYIENSLVRGDLVTRQGIRVSTWLRTDGAPEYLHILKAQVINFRGNQLQPSSYAEMFLPTA
jgi:hypothetical protein